MPNDEEFKKVFDSLVKNGFAFLKRATDEVTTSPKLSVADFAAGLELLLKARLFDEHWALVSARPHGTRWESVRNGSLKTVGAADLVDAIAAATDTRLDAEKKVFGEVFDHRNRALHFVLSEDSHSVIAEQFRGWHHLHQLITERWSTIYHGHEPLIQALDRSFRKHKEFLDVRFAELQKAHRFSAADSDDALMNCLVCGHASGILQSPAGVLSSMDCPVCLANLELARLGCGNWIDRTNGFFGYLECECGSTHSPEDLARLVDDSLPMSPKEQYVAGDPLLHCGACFQYHSVAPYRGALLCVGCGTRFELDDRDDCGWCTEAWAGLDCSETTFIGCEFCEGRAGEIRDE